ncbi:virB8 family protein [Sphingomonas sp. Leaf4]|uniref:virB8 family protein n=1 Tax=Sphingomonas sp. Leaf4 TaxID=2876553 RepID=UPI001E31651D|nr:type IV secretion system protein [Sphingomonas sp. Leaf4]
MTERQSYFARSRSWADDGVERAARSRRIAWTIAGVAVGGMALEAVALAMLAPLKTVQPVTLLVDRNTGFVQALDPVTPQRVAADAALTDAYLAQFVMAREGFDRATVQRDYRRVALWSAGPARSSYLATMAAGNPANPAVALPAGTIVSVRVKSVSRLRPGLSLVRFDTTRTTGDGRPEKAQPWISVVRFRFSDAPMSFADRLENPLGFQVAGYRRDAEAPVTEARPLPSSGPSTAVPQREYTARPTTPVRTETAVPATQPARRAAATDVSALLRRGISLNRIPLGSPLQSMSPVGDEPS